MAETERLDDQSLQALLGEEISAAVKFDGEELSSKRAKAIEYYEGTMSDTPSAQGRSSVVSRDVADTIGWMLPGIIRVFTASDQMAEFEPVGRNDEEGAKQATDYINHVFWKDNAGYRNLWDATHDSLLQGNGIVKHWWDESEECEYSEHTGLTAEQIALIEQDGGEVVSQEPGEPQRTVVPGPDGQPQPIEIETWNVKVKRVEKGRIRIDCIEPENFLKNREAITIEDARFVAHRDEKTRSELIEMGFSKEQVDELPAYSPRSDSEETIARDDSTYGSMVGHRSTELIELYECYIQADVDGDGISETVRAYYAGKGGAGTLLDWEVWDDDVPFSDIPCDPIPHRWDARSLYDKTGHVQRVKTVLTRQFLDNLYWINNPQTYAQAGGVENPEALVSPTFGGVVWLNNKATMPPAPLTVEFVGDKALMGLEHFDRVIEKGTGVSKSTQALDPETLQNQTATANQNQRDASYSQVELIARNQAELGWRRVFKMLLRLIVKHQDRPRTIRLRDKWVEIDPRQWNANMDVTVNVGLGTGSRDRDMQMLSVILQTQQGIAQGLSAAGRMDKAIQMIPKIIKTATKLAESSGIRNPDEYYPEFPEPEVNQMVQQAQQAAAQGDPKIAIEKEKMQLDVQKSQVEMQMDAQKNQNDIILQREKIQGELMLKREQMAMEFELKRWQIGEEMALKRQLSEQEMQMKREQGFYAADRQAEVGKYKADAASSVHMGGEPG